MDMTLNMRISMLMRMLVAVDSSCAAAATFLQVITYDVSSQEQLWSTQPGHTETIFDCCMHPVDPRLLATCSYDGSVRVWDVGSGSCVKTLDVPNSAGRESQGE
jgi:WD40 repeat protein